MQYTGLIIGVFCFAIIGLFHPIVIKCEYHFSCRVWPVFLAAGLLLLLISLFVGNVLASCCLSVTGVTCLWSIGELRQQRERVRKGWFPENPNRKKARQRRRAR